MGSFHVRHNLTPRLARQALLVIRTHEAISLVELRDRARRADLDLGTSGTADKVVASLRDLGFVTVQSDRATHSLHLTGLGKSILELTEHSPSLFAEYVHLRYWVMLSLRPGTAYSWSYRRVSALLWDASPVVLDPSHLVSTVLVQAAQEFPGTDASFSSSSLLGVLHWLRALTPPVFNGSVFRRRDMCTPEALTVALVGLASTESNNGMCFVRLDEETRLRLARALLLDPRATSAAVAAAEEAGTIAIHPTVGGELVAIADPVFPELLCLG